MDASQFTMWLQGFAELSAEPPTKEQWQSIREHLQLVFVKVTPEVKAPAKPIDNNKAINDFFERNRQKPLGDYCIPAPPPPPWLAPNNPGLGVITC